MKQYVFTFPDCEYESDWEPYTSAIIDGGGTITSINWSGEDGDNAYIHFQCRPEQLESIKQHINELL